MSNIRILGLAGGVGGAKLAHGLAQVDAEGLAVIVNTGDDFDHVGLKISPDVDTVLYTLGGIANRSLGWGIEGESWAFMNQLALLGGPDWFRLGDRDLATHVLRTMRLSRGERLTTIVDDFRQRLRIQALVLPMTDAEVPTTVLTPEGDLPFQEYFVGRRCEVPVLGFRFEGIMEARPTQEVTTAIASSSLTAILLCPSNPYVSIDPILSVPGLKEQLRNRGVPIIAVSPIIDGTAIKGPAAKLMQELGHGASVIAVAEHYLGFIDGLVIDHVDAPHTDAIKAMGIEVMTADALMRDDADRKRLAETCLRFAGKLGMNH